MSFYAKRAKIEAVLERATDQIEALLSDLIVEFENERDDWIRTSAKRRRREDKTDETIFAVQDAIKGMRSALSRIEKSKAPARSAALRQPAP